jgi:hypothetical protein
MLRLHVKSAAGLLPVELLLADGGCSVMGVLLPAATPADEASALLTDSRSCDGLA